MNLLLIYYHPIVFDLAESFKKICDKVTIAVNISIKDNYGRGADVLNKVKQNSYLNGVSCIPLAQALATLKQYDLVGCDGVFDGDALIIEKCKQQNIPWFCINGYPHNLDEPSDNILSFSHYLPQTQYRKSYPSEGRVKEIDWRNIAEKGRSDGKNILVFYPEMSYVKRFYESAPCFGPCLKDEFVSLIHRFEECNRWNYEVFKKIKNSLSSFDVVNYTNLNQQETLKVLMSSYGLLHSKHADCPGIAVLEALLLDVPVYTMKSFINASFNQEVLIDGYNAIIADDLDELIERMEGAKKFSPTNESAMEYIRNLTSFTRQQNKLERFFERCLK